MPRVNYRSFNLWQLEQLYTEHWTLFDSPIARSKMGVVSQYLMECFNNNNYYLCVCVAVERRNDSILKLHTVHTTSNITSTIKNLSCPPLLLSLPAELQWMSWSPFKLGLLLISVMQHSPSPAVSFTQVLTYFDLHNPLLSFLRWERHTYVPTLVVNISGQYLWWLWYQIFTKCRLKLHVPSIPLAVEVFFCIDLIIFEGR